MNGRGLNGALRIEGQAGQRVSVALTQNTYYRASAVFRDPSGAWLHTPSLFGTWYGTNEKLLGPFDLGSDGVYSLLIDPRNDDSGQWFDSGSVRVTASLVEGSSPAARRAPSSGEAGDELLLEQLPLGPGETNSDPGTGLQWSVSRLLRNWNAGTRSPGLRGRDKARKQTSCPTPVRSGARTGPSRAEWSDGCARPRSATSRSKAP